MIPPFNINSRTDHSNVHGLEVMVKYSKFWYWSRTRGIGIDQALKTSMPGPQLLTTFLLCLSAKEQEF